MPLFLRMLIRSLTSFVPGSVFALCCFSIIKGKQPPVSFQITFFLDKDKASNLFNDPMLANNQDIDGFTLHLSYRNHTLSLSTGTVFSRFSLDRDSERLWDHYVAAWIKQKQLDFEEA